MSNIKLSEVIVEIAAGPFGSNLKVSSFVDNGFPIIDGANLKGFKVTDNVTKFVTEEKARSLKKSIAKRNDVIVTISGTIGQISYIPPDSEYEEYLCSQRQFRVSFDLTRVYPPYIVFYFHTREGRYKLLSFANQVGVPALSQPLKNFKNIEINLPNLERQKGIAKIIESFNNKIELNEKINDNLSKQISALIAHEFPYSADELISGWHKVKLAEVASFTNGYSYKGGDLKPNDDTALVTIKNFDRYGGFKLDGFKELIPSSRVKPEQYANKFDILVAHTDLTQNAEVIGNAEVVLSKEKYGKLVFSMDLVCVRPIGNFGKFVLAALLHGKKFKEHCLGYVNGTTVLHLSKSALEEYCFLAPDDASMLCKLDLLLGDLYRKQSGIIEENIRLSETRDLLMKKLLSGEAEPLEFSER